MKAYLSYINVDIDMKCNHVTIWAENSISGFNYNDIHDICDAIKNIVCVKYIHKNGTEEVKQDLGVNLDHCILSKALQDMLDYQYNIESKVLPIIKPPTEMKIIDYKRLVSVWERGFYGRDSI